MSLLPFLYNHSGQLRREIQPIQIQLTLIIHHNRLYVTFLPVQPNLFFLFQQCFVSRRAAVVGRVGTNGGVALGVALGVAPPTTLLSPSTRAGRSFQGFAWGGFAPGATLYFDVQNYL